MNCRPGWPCPVVTSAHVGPGPEVRASCPPLGATGAQRFPSNWPLTHPKGPQQDGRALAQTASSWAATQSLCSWGA